MLQSMTAFGQAVFRTEHQVYTWQLRSVNHRHLDISVRLPESLRFLEADIRNRLSSQLHRGKLEASLKSGNGSNTESGIGPSVGSGVVDHNSPAHIAGSQLVVNDALLQQLSDAVDRVQALRIDAGRCDPLALLQWPGVVTMQTRVDDSLPQGVLSCLDEALADYIESRKREGQSLVDVLRARVQSLQTLLAELRRARPAVVEAQRQKLQSKLSQLAMEHDAWRLEQELVYAAQRLDIDEELDRLDTHIAELALVFKRCEPTGRRLDFLMQELNREVNTIASKASDSKTTAISIDMKVLIEQMREQIQNIE